MAPEVFKEEHYNFKCDVWSLGIILYELLYGTTPWNSSKGTQEDLFNNNILKKKLMFNESIEIREKTQELLKGMLEIDQDKRISFQDILNHKALERKDKKLKQMDDSDLNSLKKSINQNIELLNKNPLVENCYIAKKKTMDFEKIEKIGKKMKIEEKYEKNHHENDIEEEKTNAGNVITADLLKKQDEITKQAEDYVGFSNNIVTFLRKVFHSFKSNEKTLKNNRN